MKILLYNWADCYSPYGGGVTVYLRDLIDSNTLPNDQIFFISCGWVYDVFRQKPFWREIKPRHNAVKRYVIVNSSVMATGRKEDIYANDSDSDETIEVFLDFLLKTGPYDIIHFHNLEGLPLNLIPAIKERFPGTSLLFSAHNYYPICHAVMLWDSLTNTKCSGDDFRGCNECIPIPNYNKLKYTRTLRDIRKKSFFNNFLLLISAKIYHRFYLAKTFIPVNNGPHTDLGLPQLFNEEPSFFAKRRENYIRIINEYFDKVLCVSERVKEIYTAQGVKRDKLLVNYIGTNCAPSFDTIPSKRGPVIFDKENINLIYLGYASHAKGFYFLIEALECMPDDLAHKIGVFFCAQTSDQIVMTRLARLRCRFRFIKHKNGYRRDELDNLLKGVTIGLVPSMWEDNLPQTAIEMHSRKIPLLCSDLGGARELANCPDFVFKNGDIEDFLYKLRKIIDSKITYEYYFKNSLHPITFCEHAKSLLEIYSSSDESIHYSI